MNNLTQEQIEATKVLTEVVGFAIDLAADRNIPDPAELFAIANAVYPNVEKYKNALKVFGVDTSNFAL